jgi:hypothetical protein
VTNGPYLVPMSAINIGWIVLAREYLQSHVLVFVGVLKLVVMGATRPSIFRSSSMSDGEQERKYRCSGASTMARISAGDFIRG